MHKIKTTNKRISDKLNVIIFSYKRAILLDACIKSIIKFTPNINYPINVIYNFDNQHHKSYLKLKKIYGNKIKIYKRVNKSIFNDFKLILRPLNLIWIYKWKRIITNYSNFKDILESILQKSESNLTMLCTDDTFFFKKNHIHKNIYNQITEDGKHKWYRSNYGSELQKSRITKILNFNKKKYLNWEADNYKITYFMSYNFQVEGSIYSTKFLLKFLKPYIYYNPTTLEAIGYKEAKYRNFFNSTFSPYFRTAATYEVNSVQKDTKLRLSDRPQVNTEYLMKLFLKDYRLFFKINNKNFITKKEFGNIRLIPKKIYVKSKDNKIIEIKKLFPKFNN